MMYTTGDYKSKKAMLSTNDASLELTVLLEILVGSVKDQSDADTKARHHLPDAPLLAPNMSPNRLQQLTEDPCSAFTKDVLEIRDELMLEWPASDDQ